MIALRELNARARELGLSRQLVHARVRLGWSPEEARTTPKSERKAVKSWEPLPSLSSRLVTSLDGHTSSVAEHAARLGISVYTVDGRVRLGWTIEEACTHARHSRRGPRPHEKTVTSLDGHTGNLAWHARRLGIRSGTVTKRIQWGWTPEEACTHRAGEWPARLSRPDSPGSAGRRIRNADGIEDTISGHARRLGVGQPVVSSRLARGYTPEEAVSVPRGESLADYRRRRAAARR